ncbi:MAG: hypothetical protein CXZ00_11835 [Acidobacteria bacterium]|nr:MAG: hypothetical protein CXZ00_11835 [Acidobacteriota bacterium]
MAVSSRAIAGDARQEALNRLIDALNADTDMVLVAAGADADALAPVVWARAGFLVQIEETASDSEALRVMLQDVLNRGRDAALVAWLEDQAVTAELAHKLVIAYCRAGDEVWAVRPERNGQAVLIGRRMIEKFLRGDKSSTVDQILAANSTHVLTIPAASSGTATSQGS